jgi:geranylgeranylglycerol-phosphate geranylgeranyltransferase
MAKKVKKKQKTIEVKKVESRENESKSLSVKEKTKAYMELSRVGNSLMAGIAILIGFFLSNGTNAYTAFFATLSGMFICSAGQAINDYFDADIDAKTSKNRPIPSGRIEKRKAMFYAMWLFFFGIVGAFFINLAALGIAVIFAILLIAYPMFMNKVKYAGNFVVAAGTAITFIYGAAATGFIPNIVVFLAVTAFFSNLAREITKDIEDIRKDKGAKRTLPMVLSARSAKVFVAVYYALAIIGGISAYSLFQLNNYFLAFILLSSAVFIYATLLLFTNCTEKSQKVSKIGMLLSLLGFILIVL